MENLFTLYHPQVKSKWCQRQIFDKIMKTRKQKRWQKLLLNDCINKYVVNDGNVLHCTYCIDHKRILLPGTFLCANFQKILSPG